MPFLWIVAVAWMFIVVLMTVAEAVSPVGTVLGALVTFLFYGVLPLWLVMYLLRTPARRRARHREEIARPGAPPQDSPLPVDPDAGRLASGDAIPPEREES